VRDVGSALYAPLKRIWKVFPMPSISATVWYFREFAVSGKIPCYPSISLSTPGDGMSMCPPPFLWHTTTNQCWPGILRLISQIASGRRGIGMLEIWGKLTVRPNLCYFATWEKNCLREEDRLGDFTRPNWLQNLVGPETAMDAA